MSRRRLSAILTSTVLAVGALAVPAAAVELDTTATELPTEAVVQAAEQAADTATQTAEQAPVPTASPTPPEELPSGIVEDTADEVADQLPADPTGVVPAEVPTGDDGTELGQPTSYSRTRTAGSGTRGAPAPEGVDADAQEASPRVAPPRAPRFDRGALSRVPAASAIAAPEVAAPEVAAPEVAAPRVAPSGGLADDVLAAPAGMPLGPVVPGALRAATAALVLGAAVTWRRTWDSLQA